MSKGVRYTRAMRVLARVLGAVVWLACAPAAAAPELDIDPAVRAVLTNQLRFSESDFVALRRGAVVKHGLPTRAPGEVAVVGAVRINAPKAAFFARVRDIVRFKNGPDILQIGRFSRPPVLEDLAALTIEKDDFDVRSCRVGDCGIRLPAAAIERIRSEVDPKAPDAQQRGAAVFKQILLEQVTEYLAGADHALQYDDGPQPIRPREEYDRIVAEMPELHALRPQGAQADEFLYWSKERFGLEPFITVTHVAIVCAPAATCVMTTRDVYSSRYLDASIALAIAADAGTPNAFYLVYDNRTRASALKGMFAGLRRSLAERRARGSLEESLKRIKMQLEKD
jgi:hypothetical protein